ncbi:NTPase [Algoriphagus kandeliae]|uniref:NTPase n=1 Tax=Algoriphagus kandeliae TaxID=2562278 RepID=A0A4Y9QXN6_9BACT|nr:NTPase [Algoriphagus kandeliae]TFV95966.1 NTPase [Algoriphagus kandeliae]
MKYFFFVLLLGFISLKAFPQNGLPQSFYDGKSVVLVSVDPGARPVMDWKIASDTVHHYLVEAGGDPVAYYELEQVVLSEEVQAAYAKAFEQRLVKNIILITRQKNQSSIHIGEFSGDGKVISSTALYGSTATNLPEAGKQLANAAKTTPSKNLLVIDVPEFPSLAGIESNTSLAASKFLPRNPLNLEVFKLGIPLEGSSAATGFLSFFRFDLFGKSPETILAEQATQKTQLESILNAEYPHEFVWLTEPKTNEELIRDRVQFLLIRVEGREADLKKSMGLEADPQTETETVVKYYIKLIVRDELYIGPEWDADPDWRVALRNFLRNLKK